MKLFLFSFIAILLTSCINKQGTAKFDVADGVFLFDELDDQNTIDGNQISFNVSTLSGKDTVRGEAIDYSCSYDNIIDQSVSSGASDCSLLSVSFNAATGAFSWTPTLLQAGTYEFKIIATVSGESKSLYFSSIVTPSVDLDPSVTSINRKTAQTHPTNATSVIYTVIFSETVTGVATTDFAITATGTAVGTIASITGSGTTYDVTVNTISGNGDLRLDLNDANSSIVDSTNNTLVPNTQNGNQVFSIINPVEPTSVTAKVKNHSTIEIAWTGNVSYYDTYTIAYQTGATAPISCNVGTVIPYTSITGTSHRVTGLTLGTTYSFRVCANYTDGSFGTVGATFNDKTLLLSSLCAGGATVIIHNDYIYSAGYAGSSIIITEVQNNDFDDKSPVGIIRTNDRIPLGGLLASGNYLYILSSNSTAEDLTVYDISDPSAPILVDTPDVIAAGVNYSDAKLDGNYIYIATESDLFIVDISNPTDIENIVANQPTAASLNSAGNQFRYIVINGNYLYTVRNEINIIDITDKANPTLVTNGAPAPLTPASCDPSLDRISNIGSTIYLTCSNLPYGLQAVDASNITVTPVESDFYATTYKVGFATYTYANHIFLVDNQDYLGPFGGGDIVILEHINNYPMAGSFNPTTISGNPLLGGGTHAIPKNDKLYAFIDGSIKIYDITTPSMPSEMDAFELTPGLSLGMYYNENILSIITTVSTELVDVSDVSHPVRLGNFSSTMAGFQQAPFHKDDYLYIATAGAVNIYDISDPSNPTHLPGSTFASSAASYAVNVANLSSGATDWLITANADNTFTIFDISAAPAISEVGTTQATNYSAPAYNIMKVGAYDEYFFVSVDQGIDVYHLSDTTIPVTQITIGNEVATFNIEGEYIYVLDDDNALYVVDISTSPATPSIIGIPVYSSYTMPSSFAGNRINTIGNRLILTTYFGGMEIFDISTPSVINPITVVTNRFGISYGFYAIDIDDEDIGYFNDTYGLIDIIDATDPATIYTGTIAR